MLKLYQNIRDRRMQLGMSQTELARRCGYTDRSSVAKIEAGKIDLTQSKIQDFANALCLSMPELMGMVGEQEIENDIDISFYGEYKQLDQRDKETIRDMVRLMRSRRNK